MIFDQLNEIEILLFKRLADAKHLEPRLRIRKNTSRNTTHKQILNSKPFQPYVRWIIMDRVLGVPSRKPICYSNDLRMHNIYEPRLSIQKNTSRNPTHKQRLNSKSFQPRCKMDHLGPSFGSCSL